MTFYGTQNIQVPTFITWLYDNAYFLCYNIEAYYSSSMYE